MIGHNESNSDQHHTNFIHMLISLNSRIITLEGFYPTTTLIHDVRVSLILIQMEISDLGQDKHML